VRGTRPDQDGPTPRTAAVCSQRGEDGCALIKEAGRRACSHQRGGKTQEAAWRGREIEPPRPSRRPRGPGAARQGTPLAHGGILHVVAAHGTSGYRRARRGRPQDGVHTNAHRLARPVGRRTRCSSLCGTRRVWINTLPHPCTCSPGRQLGIIALGRVASASRAR